MKQIIQDLKSGNTILENVPAPLVRNGCVLIKTHKSLVSLGTERMLVEFGKASYLEKARQQPEKVKQVIDKIKADGLVPTMEAVFRKLGEPLPLGYCNAGEVIGVGKGVTEFTIGDRVVSNGHHAEVVCIPKNLVAKIPENVSYEHAAFTVIGAIGLQGIRLIAPTFGETIVVTGLGLIGLIAGQILKANGCNVIGFDFDKLKVDLAKESGIDAYLVSKEIDPVQQIYSLTNGIGCDAVLITASTKSNDVISQAANMCRKKGRIVLVGVVGLDIQRNDFFKKELSFQVSCSYGPGRYDEDYEEKGNDYPIGYVRWTEKRNFEAILNAILSNQLKLDKLITERISLDDYLKIYNDMGNKNSIASILEYNTDSTTHLSNSIKLDNKRFDSTKGIIGVIGAGNFTASTILPNLSKLNANIKIIASSKGLTGTIMAKKFKIPNTTTDENIILNDPEVDTIFITTRHNQHANQVLKGLESNKNIFVEKPLALNEQDLNDITDAYQKSNSILMVGFNRRFSPHIQKIKSLLSSNTNKNFVATMNAGFIPSDHWVQDMEVGGGRIIGEACHHLDLLMFLSGSRISSICMNSMGNHSGTNTDNASILIKFENGDNGVVNYFSNGSKAFSVFNKLKKHTD